MSTRPRIRTVVRHSVIRQACAFMCMPALALALMVQGAEPVTPDGLRLVGGEYHARDLQAVERGFAVISSSWTQEKPGVMLWAVPEHELQNGDIFKGTYCDTPAELIAHFRSLPPERTARGMFIINEFTHLADLEASREHMTDYQETLLANPKWLEERKKSLQKLVDACEKEKIDLWINVDLVMEGRTFRKLTR